MVKLIGFLFFFALMVASGQSTKIDSLQQTLITASPEQQFETYLALAFETQRNDPQVAVDYLEKAKGIIDVNEHNYNAFRYYAALLRNKLFEQDYDSGLTVAEKALARIERATDQELIDVYSSIGTCYYHLNNYDKAIATHLKALKICEESIENEAQRANVLNNISVVFIPLEDWVKAETYLTDAQTYAEKYKNRYEITRANSNLAIVYAMQNKYDLSAEMFQKEIDHSNKIGDKLAVAHNYGNLGKVYELKGDLKTSLKNHQSALDIAKEIDDKLSIGIGYQSVATILGQQKQYSAAIEHYETGLSLIRSLGNLNTLKDGLLGFSDLYDQKGDAKKALEYYKEYHHITDSINYNQHLTAVSELETKYETEKKQNEILSLSEESLQKEATIVKKNSWIRTLSIGGLSLIILAVSLFMFFRQKSRLDKQNAVFEAMAQTEIKEQHRIARDLHDSIGVMLAAVKNQLSGLNLENKKEEEQLKKSQQLLAQTADETRRIAHDMMPEELTKFGLVNALESLLQSISSEKKIETDFVHFWSGRTP